MSVDEWRAWWKRHGERELRCILMTAWDPVGAGFEPNAWDEYDDYAFGIARQLHEAANAEVAREGVARALDEAETDFMGTESSRRSTSNQQLATALVAWHEWSFVRAGGTVTEPPHDRSPGTSP